MNRSKVEKGKWYAQTMQELCIVAENEVSIFVEIEGEEIFLAKAKRYKKRISGPYKFKVMGGEAFVEMPHSNTVARRKKVHTNMDRLPEESGAYDSVRNGARLDRLRDQQEARKLRFERRRENERARREAAEAEKLRKELAEQKAAAEEETNAEPAKEVSDAAE